MDGPLYWRGILDAWKKTRQILIWFFGNQRIKWEEVKRQSESSGLMRKKKALGNGNETNKGFSESPNNEMGF